MALLNISGDLFLRGLIYNRANITGGLCRVTNAKRTHCSKQHIFKILGYILLHVKHAQGRAALASRLKRADDHILYGVLEQRRTVDDHCI